MTNINFYKSEKSASYSSNYLTSFSIETDDLIVNGTVSADSSGNYKIHFFPAKIDEFGFKKLILNQLNNVNS